MGYIPVIMAGLTAIILFVFGLENFSTEIEKISGERFRKFLARATRIPILGALIGEMRCTDRHVDTQERSIPVPGQDRLNSPSLRRPFLLWQIHDFEHGWQRPFPA